MSSKTVIFQGGGGAVWRDVIGILERTHRVLLTTHVGSDADGVGCELALARVLKRRGKHVDILNPTPTQARYSFMLGEETVDGFVAGRDEERVRSADTIIVLDINRWDRLGELAGLIRASDATKLCIDHHPRPEYFGPHDVSEPNAAATGMLMYELIQTLEGDIPDDVIVPLYAAVMTDTGSFRFANTSPRALEIGSDLVRRGVRPNEVFREIYESSSPQRMRLLGEVLRRLEYEANGRVVHFTIPNALLRECEVDRDDADGFTDVVRNVEGSQVVISFVETEDGGTKISLRSKGDVLNVSEIANDFGGGGHANASGIADLRPLAVAKPEILATVLERLSTSREV